jgi:putative transposase
MKFAIWQLKKAIENSTMLVTTLTKEEKTMAKTKDTTFFENKLLDFVTAQDPMLEMMQWMMDKFMELEVAHKTGAEKGLHAESRTGYRSGYRVRRFDTRLGTVYLSVPKLRQGGYIPFFVTEKKRSEQALIQVVQECWMNGVSTRKIENIAKKLGIETLSASEVSEINKGLDEMIAEFRTRRLESEYPVIWADALYEKIRDNHRITGKAVMVIKAVNLEGKPEILAVEPMENESEETYSALFRNLQERGLEKVWLCVSDAHKGLQAAIRNCLPGTTWQRCKVHFMRNILAYVPQKEKETVGSRLKLIWKAPDENSARELKNGFCAEFEKKYPRACECLEEGFEDSIQFYAFGELDSRKISSTNTLERLNREIRRRSSVVGIFPSTDSYIRLITSYLLEYTEDWQTEKAYMNAGSIQSQKEILFNAA